MNNTVTDLRPWSPDQNVRLVTLVHFIGRENERKANCEVEPDWEEVSRKFGLIENTHSARDCEHQYKQLMQRLELVLKDETFKVPNIFYKRKLLIRTVAGARVAGAQQHQEELKDKVRALSKRLFQIDSGDLDNSLSDISDGDGTDSENDSDMEPLDDEFLKQMNDAFSLLEFGAEKLVLERDATIDAILNSNVFDLTEKRPSTPPNCSTKDLNKKAPTPFRFTLLTGDTEEERSLSASRRIKVSRESGEETIEQELVLNPHYFELTEKYPEAFIPLTIRQVTKRPTTIPSVSPQLKNLIETAIAEAAEDDKSKNLSPKVGDTVEPLLQIEAAIDRPSTPPPYTTLEFKKGSTTIQSVSPQLKNLFESAIAGAAEDDKSKNVSPRLGEADEPVLQTEAAVDVNLNSNTFELTEKSPSTSPNYSTKELNNKASTSSQSVSPQSKNLIQSAIVEAAEDEKSNNLSPRFGDVLVETALQSEAAIDRPSTPPNYSTKELSKKASTSTQSGSPQSKNLIQSAITEAAEDDKSKNVSPKLGDADEPLLQSKTAIDVKVSSETFEPTEKRPSTPPAHTTQEFKKGSITIPSVSPQSKNLIQSTIAEAAEDDNKSKNVSPRLGDEPLFQSEAAIDVKVNSKTSEVTEKRPASPPTTPEFKKGSIATQSVSPQLKNLIETPVAGNFIRVTRARAKNCTSPRERTNSKSSGSSKESKEQQNITVESEVSVEAEPSPSPRATRSRAAAAAKATASHSAAVDSLPSAPLESNPSSPSSSTTNSTILEDDKEQKAFKKSMMLIWNRIAAHKFASIFLKPITDETVPGYSKQIKRPMDLMTIKKYIESGTIRTVTALERDLYLMFLNALMFNSVSNSPSQLTIFAMTSEMETDTWEILSDYNNTQKLMKSSQENNEASTKKEESDTEMQEDSTPKIKPAGRKRRNRSISVGNSEEVVEPKRLRRTLRK